MLRRARADVVSATNPQARFSNPSFGEMKRGRLRRARGRRRGRAHHESHRCAGRIAVVLDARLRLSLRPQANPRICSDTRGRHGRIREELAAGIIEKPRRQGVDASLPPAESLPAPKNFFAKTSFTQRPPPLCGRTIFGQVFGRGGMTKFSKWKVPPTGGPTALFFCFRKFGGRVMARGLKGGNSRDLAR